MDTQLTDIAKYNMKKCQSTKIVSLGKKNNHVWAILRRRWAGLIYILKHHHLWLQRIYLSFQRSTFPHLELSCKMRRTQNINAAKNSMKSTANIVSGCSVFVTSGYIKWKGRVKQYLHWNLCGILHSYEHT